MALSFSVVCFGPGPGYAPGFFEPPGRARRALVASRLRRLVVYVALTSQAAVSLVSSGAYLRTLLLCP